MWVCEVNRSEALPDGAKRRGGRTASSASNSNATWTYLYDNRGHVLTQTLAIPGQPNQTFQYAYSAYGALASVTYPDGQVVAYAPDALGRPTQAGSYATGATYQTDGSLESFTYAGGHDTWLATEYISGRLHNLTVGNGGTLVYSEDFTYDPNANIVSVRRAHLPRRRQSCSHVRSLRREMHMAAKHEFWADHVKTWQAGGTTQARYCREHQLAPGSFSYWRRKLRVAAEPATQGMIPIVSSATSGPAFIDIALRNGLVVRVAPAAEPSRVVAWVRVLAAC